MLSINKVMITGRLTRDPETKYMPSGNALTVLGIAVNRRYQDRNGEWKDETMFIDVETWGKTAERCAESFKKGQPVFVDGRLKQDSWERDGQKQTKIRISADIVKSFEVPQRSGQGGDFSGDTYEGEEGGGAASRPPAAKGSRPGGASSTGAPSDNLNFGESSQGSAVQDDVPF